MASSYWIKLYHELLHDPKVMRLPDRLFRRFIEMLLMAGERDDQGSLPPVEDMAWTLRGNVAELEQDLSQLEAARLVRSDEHGWIVTKFAERQAPVPGVERVQRYRDRKHKAEYYGNDAETSRERVCNAPVTNRYIDTDVDTDTDVDEDAEAPAAPEVEQRPVTTTAAAPSDLGRLLSAHGIVVSSTVQVDMWRDMYQDAGPELFQQALMEATATASGIPKPKYVDRIIKRCQKESLSPGQWHDPPARASPAHATIPEAPTTFRNPISGEVETV